MPGPNTYKVVWTFVEPNGGSFSEIYYATGTNPSDLLPQPPAGVNARLTLLDPSCTWQKIRVANVSGIRSTAQRIVNWGGYATPSTGPSIPGAAMVCNLVGTSGGSRKLWMRGLPGDFVSRGSGTGRDIFSDGIQKAFTAFVTSYSQSGYGLRILQPQTKYTINTVDSSAKNGTALVTFTIPAGGVAPNWTYPTRVVIGGADKKTLPGLNGHWTIVTGTANTVTIKYVVANYGVVTGLAGTIKQESYSGVSLFAPNLSQPAYWGTHTTRNPITNSRGARRASRIRTLA